MPPTPNPKTLHQALTTTHPLNWGTVEASVSSIAELYGKKATKKSLELLEKAVAVEPQVTADFLDSIPSGSAPYQLDSRVKSPESLARKMRDQLRSDNRRPVDDLLRYTVLTDSPDDLVAAALDTADALASHGWQVDDAMHSYSAGSRYKGIHACLRTPDIERVEVQWHSVASAQVKELTTPWYKIERSVLASDDEREAARDKCVAASAGLDFPAGLDTMTELGGAPVQVRNYSDSRSPETEQLPEVAEQSRRPTASHDRGKGITR